MKITVWFLGVVGLAAISFGGIHSDVTSVLSDEGAGVWRCEYQVSGIDLMVPAKGFDIFFDTSLYRNISIPDGGSVDQWTEKVSYDINHDSSTYMVYGALADGDGIGAGDSISGFVVMFNWLGTGTPQPQDYQIYDSSFNILDAGQTTLIPEPATLLLFAGGLFLLRNSKRI